MLVQLVTYKYLLLVFIIYDIYTKFSFLFLTICQIKKDDLMRSLCAPEDVKAAFYFFI